MLFPKGRVHCESGQHHHPCGDAGQDHQGTDQQKAITGEDELPGAVMQVLDKDNNIIDQWTSGNEPHMIEGILIAGQTYVLHEVSAPAGYTLARM